LSSLEEMLVDGLENTRREAAQDFLRSQGGPEVVDLVAVRGARTV
jgi:hypothetical protein